jgi:hypothetical protein
MRGITRYATDLNGLMPPATLLEGVVVDVQQVAGPLRSRERWSGMLTGSPVVGDALVLLMAPSGLFRSSVVERVFTDDASARVFVQTSNSLYSITPQLNSMVDERDQPTAFSLPTSNAERL